MTERQSAEIAIKRRNGNSVITVVTVPITGDCTRRFYLMQDDYIRVKFNLVEPVTFQIGDYIKDELFGTFYMTDKQFPTFNEASGCYVYELQFNAYYMVWKNRLAMLTTTASGSRIRKETNWILTDTLANHAQEICNNLSVLGYTYGTPPAAFTKVVENTAIHAQEAVTIAYDGVDIISALNAIADAFKCEWWVRGSEIHFGKCETDTNNPYIFSLVPGTGYDANMVAITPQRNDTAYANRLYIFGGTQNIPETYGKKLEFTVTGTQTHSSESLFIDGARTITPDMFVLPGLNESLAVGSTPTYSSDGTKATFQSEIFPGPREGTFSARSIDNTLSFTLTYAGMVRPGQRLSSEWFIKVYVLNVPQGTVTEIATYSGVTEYSDTMAAVVTESVATQYKSKESDVWFSPRWNYRVCVEISSTWSDAEVSSVSLGSLDVVELEPKSVYAQGTLTYNGNDYNIRYNPYSQDPDGDYYTYFEFVNSQGTAVSAPSGFGINSKYTVAFSDASTEGLDITKIPVSFWSTDYADPSSILKIGEARLHLPKDDYPSGYVDTDSAQDNDDTVERVVIFDNIYPQCVLKVSAITPTQRKDSTENSDKSKTYWNWTQFSLTATQENGAAFNFKKNYIQGGVTLQARFLTPSEAGRSSSAGGGYKLAGMTFDVNFSIVGGNPTYTLVRNENYGAKLPNDTLCPTVGDPFVLLGWNVAALSALGLVDSAEDKLADMAEAYKEAIEEDNFIFRCRMFSDSMYALEAMPDFGRSIVVKYALSEDKATRVLGYTFRLDRPWNTPEYEVGETDAYSRIKQLEEQMKAGGVSVSNTIVENVSSSSDGTQEIDLSDYLTVQEADQLYERKGSGVVTWDNVQDKPTTIGGYGITDAYTKTESDALNFFEKYTSDNGQTYSIRLKPAYTGLWTDGFMSAGGVNPNGGGGGGVSYLKELSDVYHNSSSILRSDGTALQNGDILAYDSTNSRWYAKVENSGGGTQIQSDWNQTNTSAVDFIKNKPTIPTKVSQLTNDSGFTTNTGTITGITMNGVSKGTSGVVNLGTVITSLDGYVTDGNMEAYVDSVLAGYQPLMVPGEDYVEPSTLSNYQLKVSATGSTTRPVYISAAGTFSQASTYAGGTKVTLNGTNKGASTASFYAPTTAGTTVGMYLAAKTASDGVSPGWIAPGSVASGNTALVTGGSVYSALQNYLLKTDFVLDIRSKSFLGSDADINNIYDPSFGDLYGRFRYYAYVANVNGKAGAHGFPTSSDANALLTIDTYSDSGSLYLYQMGFSANGSIYYRNGYTVKDNSTWSAPWSNGNWNRLLFEDHNGDATTTRDLTAGRNLVVARGNMVKFDAEGTAYMKLGSTGDNSFYINAGNNGTNPVFYETSALCPNSDTASIGVHWKFWNNIYVKRWYPNPSDTEKYIEYDTTNDCFYVHGNLVVTGQVVAGQSA